jgi:hypothetical protein
MTYDIIKADSIEGLIREVNKRIQDEGVVPIGGIAVDSKEVYLTFEVRGIRSVYLQTVFKETRVA